MEYWCLRVELLSSKSANRRIFIDRHTLADDESIRSYYDGGVERRLEIAMRVFCVADGFPLCYIYIPEITLLRSMRDVFVEIQHSNTMSGSDVCKLSVRSCDAAVHYQDPKYSMDQE